MSASPSTLHERARGRSPAHDAMQAEVLAFLRQRILTAPAGAHVRHRHVEVEMPIIQWGRAVAFADIAEIWEFETGRIVNLFEIKPRIDTVGGVIRQCKAMQVMAEQSEDLGADIVSCSAIVPHDDPDLHLLQDSYPFVWAWNIQFCEESE